jgi:alginate O-acetyltransferase complex protein AlgJ
MTLVETAPPMISEKPAPAAPEVVAAKTTMAEGGLESIRYGLIQTDISRNTACWMVAFFMAALFAVPILQLAIEAKRGQGYPSLDLLDPPKNAAAALATGDARQSVRELKWLLNKDNLTRYEERLADNNAIKQKIQPRVQYALTKYLGFGNSMAIVARDGLKPSGWLYYQLGIDYIAGPGMLDPAFIRNQESLFFNDGEDDINCDPRKAIIRFHNDCAKAGVHLVFVPAPCKPMIQPAQLDRRLRFTGAIPTPNNRDYDRFVSELRAAGVDVYDQFIPKTLRSDDEPRYLEQDTHWTPQWMEEVARGLTEHVKSRVSLSSSQRQWKAEPMTVARVGDIVDALNLPDNQALFKPQEVTINRVVDAEAGTPLSSNADADVLVIGDSFSNIFHGKEKGWGEAAGFPEQIARFLDRDVEIMVRDGSAATDLRHELAERSQPLQGKRLIVWQVAMHELVVSNWQIIPINHNQTDATDAPAMTKAHP